MIHLGEAHATDSRQKSYDYDHTTQPLNMLSIGQDCQSVKKLDKRKYWQPIEFSGYPNNTGAHRQVENAGILASTGSNSNAT
jgi:hypothetical protein